MNGSPLPSLARETGIAATLLGSLALFGVAFTATLYGTLAAPPAAAAQGSAAPALASGAAGVPAKLGDTRWGSGANTYCETYVEWRTGIGNQGTTAFAAYLRLASEGLVHPGPPAPNGLVYFGPSADNEFDGHVGIYDGAGLFTSVTYYGVQQEPLADWRAPYLGWVDPADVLALRRR